MDTKPKTQAQWKAETEALKRENSMLHDIMEHIHEGILATDEEGKILFFNNIVNQKDGLTATTIGKTELEVYADFAAQPQNLATTEVIKSRKPVLDKLSAYISPIGNQTYLFYSCYPFFYGGDFVGTYEVGVDLFQIKQFVDKTISMEKKVVAQTLKEKGDAYYFLENIIGSSAPIRACISLANKAAQYEQPVMIIGATGTGKELFAQGIHNAGRTARSKFVSVNCAALPENLIESILFGTVKGAFTGAIDTRGLFEEARDGTLFLDEVNSLPLTLQGKLLRAIQEKKIRRIGGKQEIPVNCRIISASNVDLLSGEGSSVIRTDLLYRLAAMVIHIPPLKDRKEDIPDLCRHFIRRNIHNKNIFLREIAPDLLNLFLDYDWPGNVRELENMIWNATLYAQPKDRFLMIEHVPGHLQQKFHSVPRKEDPSAARGLSEAVAEYERKLIIGAVLRHHGNLTQAAKELKITRQVLYYKMEHLEIKELLTKMRAKK
ncbi:MAG TPA: sigma 54-interacting transcriptional regulator [Clostridiales bacterium]|nr:sigma 54-interacting transcriptional regulator [Clostridiales bacterium]